MLPSNISMGQLIFTQKHYLHVYCIPYGFTCVFCSNSPNTNQMVAIVIVFVSLPHTHTHTHANKIFIDKKSYFETLDATQWYTKRGKSEKIPAVLIRERLNFEKPLMYDDYHRNIETLRANKVFMVNIRTCTWNGAQTKIGGFIDANES